MTDSIIQQLQPISDTPLRQVGCKPGRATAVGQIPAGPSALAERLRAFGAELVREDEHETMHRLDELGAVVTCTSFGGLIVMRVPDVERFVTSYVRGGA